MVFYIGRPRAHRASEVKHISTYRDMHDASDGDLFEIGGYVFEWDDDCVPPELCERWRFEGDPACDSAVRQVFAHPGDTVGKDLLRAVQNYAEANPGDPRSSPVHAFLCEISQAPPTGLLASEEEVVSAQELFLDDTTQIMQAFLHYSLAGGFASPRIVRTLEAVSYVLPHQRKSGTQPPTTLEEFAAQVPKASSDRTFNRLVETLQFVLDVMACTADPDPLSPKTAYLLPGGQGWASTVRVRILHSIARWRVQMRWEREGRTVAMQDSIPISQQEMAATLSSFATVPMWCLRRLHVPPTPARERAFLALWRHVGFYMGVAPSILLRHFATVPAAEKFTVTAVLNLFFEELPGAAPAPDSGARGPTLPILVAVSNRPPLPTTLAFNVALTAHLLGEALAAHLCLPPATLRTRVWMHAALALQRAPHAFAAVWPRRGWVEKRRAAMREGMARVVRHSLGLRRTAFRPRTEGEGELAPGVEELESVETEPERARTLLRMGAEVLAEMVAVCAVAGLVGLRVVCFCWCLWRG
ncbi:uncharacterized protein BXZ73DRAFT_43758 [Epithele typhae]|uniref:uncharacterized protein n=1 Tax=Epithele typhae TaxID=378194 RepID=UPI002008D782|nr:uncharacterized protein BXZ73DRAFT_43758 [Epithele typhae]KAH9939353.1 hypothetical protein BXZ73DRAFT_43758 [Epithele typhae]